MRWLQPEITPRSSGSRNYYRRNAALGRRPATSPERHLTQTTQAPNVSLYPDLKNPTQTHSVQLEGYSKASLSTSLGQRIAHSRIAHRPPNPPPPARPLTAPGLPRFAARRCARFLGTTFSFSSIISFRIVSGLSPRENLTAAACKVLNSYTNWPTSSSEEPVASEMRVIRSGLRLLPARISSTSVMISDGSFLSSSIIASTYFLYRFSFRSPSAS
mmetsp:Transcript_21433/g.46076  ORF Transcript_21433/g.46076 Transcript_21433/m.46076 type:complete len:216 (+) Transcript_21433:277-924(+)